MATNDETAALVAAEAAKARKFRRSMKAMKSAVLEIQLILYEGVNTDEQLHAAGRILAQSEYSDVVEERHIAKGCGYTRCANVLPAETRKGRYRISLSAKKVYDLQESRHFCSPSCLIASKDFGNKLPLQRDLVESTERLMEILGLVRGSQYEARSNTVKENDMRKTPARPRNTKRGKVRSKDTRNAHPASSDRIRSPVEDRGQLESGANLSTLPTDSILENRNRVASPGLNNMGNLITPQIEQRNSTASNSSSSFESVLVMPSTSETGGKAADTNINSPLNGQKLRPEKDSLSSTSISSTVQTKFEKLKIQERVGDQEVLPMFDYGGPSDAIEGYVPSRSRREAASHTEPSTQSRVSGRANSNVSSSGLREDQLLNISAENKNTEKLANNVLREEVQRSESSSRNQQKRVKVVKEWEDLVSGSPQAGPAKMCITEVDGETSTSESANEWNVGDSAGPLSSSSSKSKDFQGKSRNLKPALKKMSKVKSNVRSVAWADQYRLNSASDIGKIAPKERASSANGDETPNFEKLQGSEDVIIIEKKIESMKLEEQQQSQTRLSDPTLDLAMAARLASAEAMATALTEAATSAAAGEVDGSEAVVQAGISILSATHNAYPASSDSPHEAQDQSGETLESMKNSALDEDELFARAAQAREEMRRLKMPRNYGEIMEKEGFENGDVIDDFKSMANEDDDDDDDDDDEDEDVVDDVNVDDADLEEEDDDYFDDDNEGFEGAREVGFTAPPKGFNAQVSMFGTMIMAVDAWISASAVAHIYGKDPLQEDDYLSVNGREYSRHTFIGDGVSAEILRTFSLCVSRALPEVVRALRISVPLSTLELALGRIIKTMSFVEALPPFGTKQWRVLVILLLDALSIHRIPRLGVYFSNNRTMLRQVLDSTETSEAEYDVFRDVVLPLGRSPTFATRSGG